MSHPWINLSSCDPQSVKVVIHATRILRAAAAAPYDESVKHAFVSYGSCIADLAESWKYRSLLWYGVGVPSKSDLFGGGGSDSESWRSVLEKGSNENWVELPLVKKTLEVLRTLLDDSGLGDGLGGGLALVWGVMAALYELLDSDQPFLCMLKMSLVSMREDDNGEGDGLLKNASLKDVISEGSLVPFGGNSHSSTRKPRPALLWSVLGPILNMPITESKRQRVLVASSILYSEMSHMATLEDVMSGRDRHTLCHPVRPAHGRRQGQVHRVVSKKHNARASNWRGHDIG